MEGMLMDLARRILRNLTGEREIRSDYLESLAIASGGSTSQEESSFFGLRSKNDIAYSASKKMVERVYRLLEPYCVELDRMNGTRGLRIACTQPDELYETIEGEWPFKPPELLAFYRARFSTCRSSIVIRGHADRVDFFIIPSEFVMMMSKAEDSYGPLMTFDAVVLKSGVEWEVEDKPLSEERLERYCLLFFEHFIKEDRKEMMKSLS